MISRDYRVPFVVHMILGLPLAGLPLLTSAAEPQRDSPELPTVRISATALDEDLENITSPFSIVSGERLFERTQGTLGDTLDGLPGVRADTFGGATRPVIRGQTAPRVKVLSDSAGLLDASEISPDHAVTTEPFLIDRIEVLRGPATLLYGSGAIGGVVNVLDKKIPATSPERPVAGAVAVRGATVSHETAAMAEVTARAGGRLVFHLEGATRDASDYRVPDFEERRALGTRAKSHSGSAGLSWVGEHGYLGLAYSYRDDDYGLPGHSHEFEGCHPHDSALHCGGHDEDEGGEQEHGHGPEREEVPMIDLLSRRVDLRGEMRAPFAGVERIRLRASHTDYQHDEMEEQQVATSFLNDGYEARVEVQHAPLVGWRGVVGAQFSETEFRAIGEEAFLPIVDSNSVGLFVVEHFELNDAWHLEAGVRQEWQKHRPIDDVRGRPARRDSGTSFSAAAIWEVAPDYHLTLSAARSQRLLHPQELYARGIHLATNTYECGLIRHPLTCGGVENNADIETETSQNVGLSLRRSAGVVTFEVSGFYNSVDDYVYARTLDQFEDFRLVKYTQADARFRGVEAEATWHATQNLAVTVFGDSVRAKLAHGENLPRIPAARRGMRLNANLGTYRGELEYYHVSEQNDIAAYEQRTPGYTMLNLTVSYGSEEDVGLSVYLRGANLLDEQVWNHSSFLANVVPLPGRSFNAGLRFAF